ncbi:2-succinyl-5-enolpyruvyl-6-hydroxy-3-cyclohexene-1-carboxylic-acid synthase [Arcanobacterium hippocoleae]
MPQTLPEESMLEPSALIAREIIETAMRTGIRHFVLCPGSRSAPLAIALAQAEAHGAIELFVETDERVAGFIALGLGKVGKPAAVITTSGSAVANLHPAVEEAFYSAVPLCVISADRPHEMRGVRASQTSLQSQILRGSIVDFVDLPADLQQPKAVANQVRRLVRRCFGFGISGASGPGPVQLNIAFAPPLQTAHSWEPMRFAQGYKVANAAGGAVNFPAPVQAIMPRECSSIGVAKRTVVVAGPTSCGNGADFAQQLARELFQIPILAEPGSALRRLPQAMPAHPVLLQSALVQEIERVIVIGHPTLTREVAGLLADPQVEVIVVDEAPTYTDVSGNAAEIINLGDIGGYATADLAWYRLWEQASLAARRAVWNHLEEFSGSEKSATPSLRLSQSEIAIALAASKVPTFYAASSIIREVNLWGSCANQDVYVNRGLAGIDGNVSTAIGIAFGLQEPVRVAVGDLAFIHDLGALVRAAEPQSAELDLQVVVLDDGGGSLFATLEYGTGDEQIFNRVFRTAREFDLAAFAKSLGNRVKFTEFLGNYVQLQEFLQRDPAGIEIVYFNLRGATMQQTRQRRVALREKVLAAVQRKC